MDNRWPAGSTHELKGLRVTLSAPVLVGRSKDFFWYPEIVRFPNGTLAAIIRLGADTHSEDRAVVSWSNDGGLTWGRPTSFKGQSTCPILLPAGEFALLPFHLYSRPDGMSAGVTMINGEARLWQVADAVEVTGWPRRDAACPVLPSSEHEIMGRLKRAHFYFNGQPVRLKDGKYLGPMYGTFEGARQFCVVTVESSDGFKWRFRSVVADENSGLKGDEGPCESTLCRLPDGRLTCAFRLGGTPFGQCWSEDDGKTWSRPVFMDKVWGVQPSIIALENGVVALSGGRPDLYVWFNADGSGETWQAIDTLQHHNSFRKDAPIIRKEKDAGRSTSAYTELVAVGRDTLLYVYDRTPPSLRREGLGRPDWTNPAGDSTDLADMFSIWVMRMTVS